MASEDQDPASKTEEPTQKKLLDAQKKGQSPMSREVLNATTMLSFLIVLTMMAPPLASKLQQGLTVDLEHMGNVQLDPAAVGSILGGLLKLAMMVLAGPVLLFMISAVLASVLQTGLVFNPEKIKPELSKLSLIKGFKRMFSMKSIAEFLKGIVKLCVVGGVMVWILYPLGEGFDHLVGLAIPVMLGEAYQVAIRLVIGVFAMTFLMAGLDYMYQRMEFMKEMRMSKQEIKDEHKNLEGDPTVKMRMRQMRVERSRKRMMAQLPKADVVITNPTHFAVALRYDPENMAAPVVLAKGQDLIAAKIREVAGDHDIPLVENPPLARALYATTDIDEEISPDHYEAVAAIISYVLKLKQSRF